MVVSVEGGGLIGRGHMETSWGDSNVLYLVRGLDYTFICQNSAINN